MVLQISRRTFLVGVPVAANLLAARATLANPAGTCAFLALGDWGRDGTPTQRAIADQMGRVARDVGSRFVVALGDNFYPRGVQSVSDAHWRLAFGDVYIAPSLQTPWYAVLGNHDYRGVPQAEIDYGGLSSRWRMPNRYYAVEGASLSAPWMDLFMLDTSPLAVSEGQAPTAATPGLDQDAHAQLEWLDRELTRSRAPLKIVFGHHTIFSGSPTHGDNPVLIETLKPILERHSVTAYICGHDHDLQQGQPSSGCWVGCGYTGSRDYFAND